MGDAEQLRFAQLLKRVFGTRAQNPGRVLTPAVSPTADVQDGYQPENRSNRGEGLWGAGLTPFNVNTVGNTEALLIINPVGSNKVTVVKKLTVSCLIPTATVQPAGTAAFFISNPTTTAVGAGVSTNSRDSRRNNFNAPLSTQYSTALLSPINLQTQAVSSIWAFELDTSAVATQGLYVHRDEIDVVLLPGSHIVIGFIVSGFPTAAWKYTLFCEGYERTIDPNELTFVA